MGTALLLLTSAGTDAVAWARPRPDEIVFVKKMNGGGQLRAVRIRLPRGVLGKPVIPFHMHLIPVDFAAEFRLLFVSRSGRKVLLWKWLRAGYINDFTPFQVFDATYDVKGTFILSGTMLDVNSDEVGPKSHAGLQSHGSVVFRGNLDAEIVDAKITGSLKGGISGQRSVLPMEPDSCSGTTIVSGGGFPWRVYQSHLWRGRRSQRRRPPDR